MKSVSHQTEHQLRPCQSRRGSLLPLAVFVAVWLAATRPGLAWNYEKYSILLLLFFPWLLAGLLNLIVFVVDTARRIRDASYALPSWPGLVLACTNLLLFILYLLLLELNPLGLLFTKGWYSLLFWALLLPAIVTLNWLYRFGLRPRRRKGRQLRSTDNEET